MSRRLTRLFLKDETGRRSVFGDSQRHRDDPAFGDHPLFHEYFHGDTGRGGGGSHQTGWTGLIAVLLQHAAVSGVQQSGATTAPVPAIPEPLLLAAK